MSEKQGAVGILNLISFKQIRGVFLITRKAQALMEEIWVGGIMMHKDQ